MLKVDKYILQKTTAAFLACLALLTGVVWITQALRQIDLLTTKGQALWVFFALSGLTIPSLLVVITPVALFMAAIWVLNRLNADSELIVLSAAGLSPLHLLRPFAMLITLVSLFSASMSMWAMPESFYRIRTLALSIQSDFLTHIIRPGQFMELAPGLIFHYREKGVNGALKGIFIQDRREEGRIHSYFAELGATERSNDQSYLLLEKGHIQRQTDPKKDPAMIVFDRYAIDLSQLMEKGEGEPSLKPRERSTLSLLWPDPLDAFAQSNLPLLRSELHERMSTPLWVMLLGLIGFAAMIHPKTTREGRGQAIGGAILFAFIARAMGFWITSLIPRAPIVGVILMYLLPIGGIGGALLYICYGWPKSLIRRSHRDHP